MNFTKAMIFTAISDMLAELPENEPMGTFDVGSGKNTHKETLTAGVALERINKELELLAKKSGKGGSKKSNEAHEKMELELSDFLMEHPQELFTVSALVKAVPEFAEYENPVTPQRVTPRLLAMEARGEVKKYQEKGRNVWQWVED